MSPENELIILNYKDGQNIKKNNSGNKITNQINKKFKELECKYSKDLQEFKQQHSKGIKKLLYNNSLYYENHKLILK